MIDEQLRCCHKGRESMSRCGLSGEVTRCHSVLLNHVAYDVASTKGSQVWWA